MQSIGITTRIRLANYNDKPHEEYEGLPEKQAKLAVSANYSMKLASSNEETVLSIIPSTNTPLGFYRTSKLESSAT